MAILAPSLTLGITSGFKIHIFRCCADSPGTRLQLEATEELLVPTEATPIHLRTKTLIALLKIGNWVQSLVQMTRRLIVLEDEVVDKVVESSFSGTHSQDVSTCPMRRNSNAKIKDGLFITLLV